MNQYNKTTAMKYNETGYLKVKSILLNQNVIKIKIKDRRHNKFKSEIFNSFVEKHTNINIIQKTCKMLFRS